MTILIYMNINKLFNLNFSYLLLLISQYFVPHTDILAPFVLLLHSPLIPLTSFSWDPNLEMSYLFLLNSFSTLYRLDPQSTSLTRVNVLIQAPPQSPFRQ